MARRILSTTDLHTADELHTVLRVLIIEAEANGDPVRIESTGGRPLRRVQLVEDARPDGERTYTVSLEFDPHPAGAPVLRRAGRH